MAFDEDEKLTLWIVICVCAGISLIGSLFIICMYLTFPGLRGYSFRLVLYLSVADLLTSIMFIIPENAFPAWCEMKGGLINFTSLWRIFLTAVIANSIFISYKSEEIDFRKREKIYIFIIAVLSVLLSILPYTTHSYGHAQGICWIIANGDSIIMGTIWRIFAYYGPLWSVFFYNTVVYTILVRRMRKELDSVTAEDIYLEEVIKRLRIYPLVLMICMVPTSLNRIYDTFNPDSPSFELTCIAFGILSCMGLFNAIVYGLTPSVKYSIISALSNSSSYTEYETDLNSGGVTRPII